MRRLADSFERLENTTGNGNFKSKADFPFFVSPRTSTSIRDTKDRLHSALRGTTSAGAALVQDSLPRIHDFSIKDSMYGCKYMYLMLIEDHCQHCCAKTTYITAEFCQTVHREIPKMLDYIFLRWLSVWLIHQTNGPRTKSCMQCFEVVQLSFL